MRVVYVRRLQDQFRIDLSSIELVALNEDRGKLANARIHTIYAEVS